MENPTVLVLENECVEGQTGHELTRQCQAFPGSDLDLGVACGSHNPQIAFKVPCLGLFYSFPILIIMRSIQLFQTKSIGR